MVSDGGEVKVGTPLVPGASVKAEIVGHGRNKKITVFKMIMIASILCGIFLLRLG